MKRSLAHTFSPAYALEDFVGKTCRFVGTDLLGKLADRPASLPLSSSAVCVTLINAIIILDQPKMGALEPRTAPLWEEDEEEEEEEEDEEDEEEEEEGGEEEDEDEEEEEEDEEEEEEGGEDEEEEEDLP